MRLSQSFDSTALGQAMNYSIYLPDGYADDQRQRYPVVYLLHGVGDDETVWARAGKASATMDRLLASAIALARQALVAGNPDLLVEGTTSVLMRPELSDVERVRRLLDTFDDKARLVQLLSRLIEGEGVRVVIGQESDLTSDLDFSLVATNYGFGDQHLGTMGIFGPSRMDYAAVIPLVNYLGDRLSRALERTMA